MTTIVNEGGMPRRWTPVVLLSLAAMINYMDRGSLSVALPFVAREMGLDPVRQGWALSAFSMTYVLAQMPMGWLVDRWPLKWLFAGAFALWCGASAATGLATGLGMLMCFRMLLGIGEAVYMPGGMKFIAEQFLPEERTIPTAVFDLGCKVGLALGLVAEVWVLKRFGWRWLFLSTGLAGLVWLLPWVFLYPEPRVKVKVERVREGWGPIWQVLRSRNAWAMACGYGSWNYFWYLLVSWGPTYLLKERGVSLGMLGWVAGFLYLVVAASEMVGGWLVQELVRRGWTLARAIRFVIALGFSIGVLALPAAMVKGQWLAVGMLYCSAMSGVLIAGIMVVPTQIAAKGRVGTWASFQNFIANIPGIVGPVVTGWIVKETGSFVAAFGVAAVVCVAGIWFYLGVLRLDEASD